MFSKLFCCFNDEKQDGFKKLKIVGKGSFGLVLVGQDVRSNSKVAIKKPCPNAYSKNMLKNEFLILMKLDHKNIIKPLDFHDDMMILPYYKQDILNMLANRKLLFGDYEIHLFMKAIASAVKYLHDKNIVHMDIKPDNILMNDDISKCVLCDFGGSKIEDEIDPKNAVGTELYAAPELFSNWERKTNFPIGKPVDIYALGTTVYTLMTGEPIPREDPTATIKKLHCSSMLKNLLIGMLQVEPENRMTIDDILKHPFMK